MKAKVSGSVEVPWNPFEFSHVRINQTVSSYSVHSENHRNIVIQNRNGPPGLRDSSLQRYLKRPAEHHSLKFLDYLKRFSLVKTLPASKRFQLNTSPRDVGSPRNYVIPCRSSDNEICAARIKFVSPLSVELFALRLILLDCQGTLTKTVRKGKGCLTQAFGTLLLQWECMTMVKSMEIDLTKRFDLIQR